MTAAETKTSDSRGTLLVAQPINDAHCAGKASFQSLCNAEHRQQKVLFAALASYLASVHFHPSLSGVTPEAGRRDFCRPLWYQHEGNRTPAQQMTWISRLCFSADFDYHTSKKIPRYFQWCFSEWPLQGHAGEGTQTSESPHPPNIPQPCKMPTCTHPFTSEKSLSSSLTGHQARNWPQPYFIWTDGKTEEGTKASMCSTASLKHALSFPPPQRAQLQCNQNQGEGPAVATNQEHSPLEYKARVAKLWGPYVAMKGIYKFSPSAPCRSTDDGLETKFPMRGEWGKERSS